MSDAVEWQDADGTVWPLTDLSTFVPAGMSGRFMPTYSIIEDFVPGLAGAVGRTIQTMVREVTVPVTLIGTSETVLRDRVRLFSDIWDPTRGAGVLRVHAADASSRELYCVYKSGHEGVETQGRYGCVYYSTALVFHAYDPYWYDTTDSDVSVSSGTSTVNFLATPFLPLKLNPSQVFGNISALNEGSVDAWPIWTIQGPGNTIILTNWSTGEVFEIDVTLASSDTLIIDTRPGVKTAVLNGTTNVYPNITAGSSFWSLIRGINEITLTMGGTTVGSGLALAWRNRYNAA